MSGRRLTKKEREKYEEEAVVINGDLLPATDERVQAAKREVRAMEQGLVDKTVEDFAKEIESKKEEITEKIVEYSRGKMALASEDMEEYVINRLFFSSLSPLSSKEPKYNAEKLAIVFDFYEHAVAEINAHICRLMPSKTSFCRFAGITTATYNGYKLSEDPDMQVIMGKIDDMLMEVHLTMAEEKKTDATAMKYRMNVEMDKRENYNPQVVLKADIKDLSDYRSRMNMLEGMFEEVDNGEK